AVRKALPEWPRGDLDARGVAVLGMARRPGAELPEVREIVQRECESPEVEQRVEQHRRVAIREDEAVAQRPRAVARIEVEIPVPEPERRAREPHRRTGMTRVRALHRVGGEEADRVLDALPERGGREGIHRGSDDVVAEK